MTLESFGNRETLKGPAVRLLEVALAIIIILVPTRPARAQSSDAAAAESAFQLGRTYLANKKYREACDAFQESMRIQKATGTLYNIGLCMKGLGRVATAWSAFKAVAADSASNAERARQATEEARLLEPRLSRVRIQVNEKDLSSIRASIDDAPIGAMLFQSGVAVDVGPHVLTAHAPGYEDFTTRFHVLHEGTTEAVTIPPLTSWRRTPQKKDAPSIPPPTTSSTQTLGWVLTSVGIVTLGGGLTMGGLAFDRASVASDCKPCVRGTDEAREATEAYDRGNVYANLANVLVPVGALAAAVGVYLVLRKPPVQSTARAVAVGALTW